MSNSLFLEPCVGGGGGERKGVYNIIKYFPRFISIYRFRSIVKHVVVVIGDASSATFGDSDDNTDGANSVVADLLLIVPVFNFVIFSLSSGYRHFFYELLFKHVDRM